MPLVIELQKKQIQLFIESKMAVKIIDTGLNSSQKNMDIDYELLLNLKNEENVIIHFYEFPSLSATYGHFLKPENFFSIENIEKYQVDLGKRPTGGGIIFHFTDFTFSLLVPKTHKIYSQNTLESYARINEAVVFSIKKFLIKNDNISLLQNHPNRSLPSFCLANPTIYDVMVGDKKIGGAAQRKIKEGFLHQGSILLCRPCQNILQDLILDKKNLENISKYSFPLVQKQLTKSEVTEIKNELKSSIISFFNNRSLIN